MDAVEREIVRDVTVRECILVDELYVFKSLYGLELRAVEERAVLDSLECRGKNDLLKRGEVSECVSADGLDALGDNYSLDIVVTDVGDLGSIL